MNFTIQKLLKMPAFSDIRILNDNLKVDYQITSYFIAEMCDSEARLAENFGKGELLIFSGLFFSGSSQTLEDIIGECKKNTLSAILIFKSPYLSEISDKAIALANEKLLPVIMAESWTQPKNNIINEIIYRIVYSYRSSDGSEGFLSALINESEYTEKEIAEHYGYGNYDFKKVHKVIVLRLSEGKDKDDFYMSKYRFSKICHDALNNVIAQPICEVLENDFVVLLPVNEKTLPAEKVLKKMQDKLNIEISQKKIFFGISDSITGLNNIRQAIHVARQSARAMSILRWEKEIRYPQDMIPYILLLEIRDNKRLILLKNTIFDPLIKQSSNQSAGSSEDLIKTLEVYLESGYNKSLTAQKLFIHRNTLQIRLAKIEKLCNIDLSNTERCFEYQFALLVNKFLRYG